MVFDYEGIVLYANQAGASMFGHSTEELQAKPLGYPLADADKTELDFCSVQIAEMRVVEIKWFERPAYLITLRDLLRSTIAHSSDWPIWPGTMTSPA